MVSGFGKKRFSVNCVACRLFSVNAYLINYNTREYSSNCSDVIASVSQTLSPNENQKRKWRFINPTVI